MQVILTSMQTQDMALFEEQRKSISIALEDITSPSAPLLLPVSWSLVVSSHERQQHSTCEAKDGRADRRREKREGGRFRC